MNPDEDIEELLGRVVRAFAPALKAYRNISANSVASGSTMAERRFSEGEAEDRANEAMFEAFDCVRVDDLIAVERLNIALLPILAQIKRKTA